MQDRCRARRTAALAAGDDLVASPPTVKASARASLRRARCAPVISGRLHIGRALAGRLAHQRFEVGGVALRLGARAHLDGGGFENTHDRVPQFNCPLASRPSSLPCRSSSCRSSEPPTWWSPMKICGKVLRPLARDDHFLAKFRRKARIVFGVGDALALEQPLGGRAIAAHHRGVDRHFDHRSSLPVLSCLKPI